MRRHQLLAVLPVLAASPIASAKVVNTNNTLRLHKCADKLIIIDSGPGMRYNSSSSYSISQEFRDKELDNEKSLRVEASKGLRDINVNLSQYGNCAPGGSSTVGSNGTSSTGGRFFNGGGSNINTPGLPRNRTDILMLLSGVIVSLYSAKILYDRYTGGSRINQEHQSSLPMWLATQELKGRYILFSAITTNDERKNIFDEYQLAKSSGVVHPMMPFYTWLDTAHPTWCSGSRYTPQQVVDAALLAAKEMDTYSIGELARIVSSLKLKTTLAKGNQNQRLEKVDAFVDECQALGRGGFGFMSSFLGGGSSPKHQGEVPPFVSPPLQPQFTPASYTATPSTSPPSLRAIPPGDAMITPTGGDGRMVNNNGSDGSLIGTREISFKDVVGEVVEQKAAVVDPLAR